MAKRVLVVDDDQNTVKYHSAVLSESGYEPIAAYDGVEGLRKAEISPPDLIVLDVMMPKKSGFVLFKQLKKDDRFKDIPVLMLTAVAGVLDEQESRAEEASERPYDSLRQALRKMIEELREEGPLRPEMFVDKPIDADEFVNKGKDVIGDSEGDGT